MAPASAPLVDNPQNVLQLVPEKVRRVLDCSSGYTARISTYLERGAEEVHAVRRSDEGEDPNTPGISSVLVGDWMKLEPTWEAAYFDCIICDDILARQADPKPLLNHLKRLLSPQGILVLTAPNLQHHKNVLNLLQGEWIYEDRGAITRDHIRFFTGFELVQLMESIGLHTERLTALLLDDDAAFPLDAEGYVTHDRIRIGPLTPEEHKNFLVDTYALLATHNAGA